MKHIFANLKWQRMRTTVVKTDGVTFVMPLEHVTLTASICVSSTISPWRMNDTFAYENWKLDNSHFNIRQPGRLLCQFVCQIWLKSVWLRPLGFMSTSCSQKSFRIAISTPQYWRSYLQIWKVILNEYLADENVRELINMILDAGLQKLLRWLLSCSSLFCGSHGILASLPDMGLSSRKG